MSNSSIKVDEDCLANSVTNAFYLTDIRGLRWKKYTSPCTNSSNTSNDPILAAYSNAIRADVLSVWRRVPIPNVPIEELGTRLFDCPKELYMFWFGEEPTISGFPSSNLQEAENGYFENGINAFTLDLFFKSIHNIIERSLLNGEFIRLGEWFTKPVEDDANNNAPNTMVAFKFSLFIHGKTSVVATVKMEEKMSVKTLSQADLAKSSKVVLAPYGLNAQLTGQHLPDSDTQSIKLLDEWKKFFALGNIKHDKCPAVVEVVFGEVKMLYPSSLVLVPSPSKTANILENLGSVPNSKVKPPKHNDAVKHCWQCIKENEPCSAPTTQLWDMKGNLHQTGCSCSSNSNTTRKDLSLVESNQQIYDFYKEVYRKVYLATNQKKVYLATNQKIFHFQCDHFVSEYLTKQKMSERNDRRSSEGLQTRLKNKKKMKEKKVLMIASTKHDDLRIKSNTNPFASSNILHGNLKSLSQNINAKSKKESTSMSPFHSRPNKPDKTKGRLTPSIVTGRSTPLLNNNNNLQTKVVPDEKPKIVESAKRKTPSPTDMKTRSTISDNVTPNLTTSPIVSTAGETKVMPTLMQTSVKVKTETADVIKQPDMLTLPCLPEESLDPRLGEDLTMEIVEILAKADVKPPDSSSENTKRTIDLVSPEEEKEPVKKIKQEPQEVQPKRVGRQRGRKKSTVQNLQPISIIDLEEDVVSPTTTSRRTSARHSTSENCIVNPAAVTESPHPTGPGRPSRRRASSRSAGTPKNENQAFNFSGSKQSVPFPSPPPNFSPSVKTSLTSIKDLVPITADLDNLFDDEDDIGALKKSSAVNTNDTVQITAPVVVNMPPPSTISQQDLQKMFPTPPSPPNAMSPVTSVHSDINVNSSTPGACMEVLSPEMQHAITVSETDHLEINLETRSPNSDYPTFIVPMVQPHLIPELYIPLSLPSERLKAVDIKSLRYTPTWDSKYNPPILSRRPSGNQLLSASDDSNKAQVPNQSVSPIPKHLYENQMSGFSPLPGLYEQDLQSLMVNLFLADSYISWIDVTQNIISLQDETYKVFVSYQNFQWNNSRSIDADLFPEDTILLSKSNMSDPPLQIIDDIIPAKHELSTDLIDLILKYFQSPFSINYFIQLQNIYYNQHKLKPKKQLQNYNLLHDLRSTLQSALQKCVRKNIWEHPKIEGPLKFSRMNALCNKSGIQSAGSTSAICVSYDQEITSLSPKVLSYWQPLCLEPFAGPKSIAYLVVLPDKDFLATSTKQFFKEYDSVYESMNLGTHAPIIKDFRDGLLRINQNRIKNVVDTKVDDWFDQDTSNLMAKMKVVAQFCQHDLGPYVSSLTSLDSSLFVSKSESTPKAQTSQQSTLGSTSNTPWATVYDEPIKEDTPLTPTVVIYIVDPFHNCPNNQSMLWSFFGLLKCFLEMCSTVTGKLKENVMLQIIPLEQILQTNLNIRTCETRGCQNAELRNLAFNVYSQCRSEPVTSSKLQKYMTSFGVGNARENLIRRRQGESNLPYQIYMPPYVLGEVWSLLEQNIHSNTGINNALSIKEMVRSLYCCYCLTRDRHWLIVTCVDEYGELHQSSAVRIYYPKKKDQMDLVWSVALRKMWEFITGLISYTITPWKIVMTKIGQFGQSELKELNDLIEQNMQSSATPSHTCGRPVTPLSDMCFSCCVSNNHKGKQKIQSVSLCTLEIDHEFTMDMSHDITESDSVHSRIYVLPSPRSHNRNFETISSLSSDVLAPDNSVLLSASFDEDQNRDLHNFLPLLSPSESNLFPGSPSGDPTTQNMLSPSNTLASSMPSLSPFQPIMSYRSLSPSKMNPLEKTDLKELCIGYMVSAGGIDPIRREYGPSILKSVLVTHTTSDENSSYAKETDNNEGKNEMTVLTSILETFDSLSWLTVNPSSGTRQSCLPVHVRTLLTLKDVFEELKYTIQVMRALTPRQASRTLRAPSFDGYFASRSGTIELRHKGQILKADAEKIGEIQRHLDHIIDLLRDIDILRMAVRIESECASKKRYMTIVSDQQEHSAIIGFDWNNNVERPTIGLVLPIWSSTYTELDGDGGFSVSRTLTRNHSFKPVSVQTLWTARQVVDKVTSLARQRYYYEGVSTDGFLEHYENSITSEESYLKEWNNMGNDKHRSNLLEILDSQKKEFKDLDDEIKTAIKSKLREIMPKMDLEKTSCKQMRLACEKELGIDLKEYRQFLDMEMIVVMGQMDTATKILDYLYLGSEYNASNLTELRDFGVGYILNITREVDNFFPQVFTYYNIRVYDSEDTELMRHWDHTYRFIEKARMAGSKILVHCRHGISRSGSTVIAYLMKKKGWSMQESFKFVKDKRNIVQPNPSFQNQLIVYDGILNSSRNRFSQLFHQQTLRRQEEEERKQEELNEKQQKELEQKEEYEGKRRKVSDTSEKERDDADISEKRRRFRFSSSQQKTPEEMGDIPAGDALDGPNSVYENATEGTGSTDLPSPLFTELSMSEETGIEEEASADVEQTSTYSHPQRGKLRRARTMTCGAIFFDEEEPDDSPSGNAFMDETKDEELMDAEEDQLMQQVVFATQMKHELLRTVQNLQSSSSEQDYRPIEHEFTVKPSVLRRLSHSSALLHFENIAKMKRRKSLTEQEMVQAIKEENEEPIVDTNTVSKSNVASLSEVFLRRSKKHVQDYARRRTVNDEKLKNFEIRAFDKDIVQNQDYLSVTRTYSEVPQYINVLETGDIVEKVNNENQIANAVLMASESTTIPMGDDKPVESKEIVTIDKAVVASSTNDDGDPQRELSSGETDHPKIGNLNRSFSLSTVCKPSRMKYQSSSTDSQIVEALDLDSSFHEADFEIVKTVSVADLVHFHDQMILDKKEKNDLKTKKNKQQFDENEIKTIGTNEISSNELNVENQSGQKNINPLRNKVQRVQSLPWYKSSELDEIPDKANALEDVVESRSLPASPRSEENVENPNPLTKHSIMAYLGIGEDERPEKGVRNLVFNFERQKRESEQPSILFVSKLKASEKVTLETSDETNI